MVASLKVESDPSCPHHYHLQASSRMVQAGRSNQNQHLRIACSDEPMVAFAAAVPCLQMQQVGPQQARDRATIHGVGRQDFIRASFLGASELPWHTKMAQLAAGSNFDHLNGLDRVDSCMQGLHLVRVLEPDPVAPWIQAALVDSNQLGCSFGYFDAQALVFPCSDNGLLREACGEFFLHLRQKLI